MLSSQEIVLRLGLAALLGSIVGLERQRHERVAGLRTHMLVCVGSALVMIVSSFGFQDIVNTPGVTLDPSRVAAQVVSGIGFLGAGTILFLRQEVVRGLTTAAGLWGVAAVGLAVGGGLYLAAVVTIAIILTVLLLIKPLENFLFPRKKPYIIHVAVNRKSNPAVNLETLVRQQGATIHSLTIFPDEDQENDQITLVLGKDTTKEQLLAAVSQIRTLPGVKITNLRYLTQG